MHKGFMQTCYQNGDLKRYAFREITESAFHSTGAVFDLLRSLGRSSMPDTKAAEELNVGLKLTLGHTAETWQPDKKYFKVYFI